MPLIPESTFKPLRWLENPHVQTCYPAFFRRVRKPAYVREEISTPDGDFLHLDWSRCGSKTLVIATHGLEGSSRSPYLLGFGERVLKERWDLLAWNCRGCSGVPNLHPYSYHSGKSEDLRTVINHVIKMGLYDQILLVGFSVGGNITLKYLGEEAAVVSPLIRSAVTFSVPVDLAAASKTLAKFQNQFYMEYFLSPLRRKTREKAKRFPEKVSAKGLLSYRTFAQWDGAYTAPLNGFSSAEEYWAKASSLPLLDKIGIPTLLLSSRDDPFLAESCFPTEIAAKSDLFFLEVPLRGGHVGFLDMKRSYWAEERAISFFHEAASSFKFFPKGI